MTQLGSNGDDPRTPHWVKVSGIIGIGVVLLFVIMHVAGGGLRHHLPGRDTPERHTPPVSVPENGGQQR